MWLGLWQATVALCGNILLLGKFFGRRATCSIRWTTLVKLQLFLVFEILQELATKTIVTAVAQVTEVIYDPLEDTVVVTIGTERILLLDNHGQVLGSSLENIVSSVYRNPRSRNFSQYRRVSSIDSSISSIVNTEKLWFILSFFAKKVVFKGQKHTFLKV